MRLLFITQKVDLDDDVLGIYHQWIAGVAPAFDQVSVICLYKGKTALPGNVIIHSLGKERLSAGRHRLLYTIRFLRLAWRLRKEYDVVFVHMNPEYLLLAGWLWKLLGKRMVFWYAHYLATVKLRVAAWFAGTILTSTRLAYPLSDRKLVVLQQGIDTEAFKPSKNLKAKSENLLRILWVGRMSPVKNVSVLVEAAAILKEKRTPFSLAIIGGPTSGQSLEEQYYVSLQQLVRQRGVGGIVEFLPAIRHRNLPEVYQNYDVFVNLTDTGSFDKTTLEAMASGVPVLVSNRAFQDLFEPQLQGQLLFKEKDAADLAEKLIRFNSLSAEARRQMGELMRRLIVGHHSLPRLVERLAEAIKTR